jgi:hypothetical protein
MEMLMVGTLRGIEHTFDSIAAGPDDRQMTVDQLVSAFLPGTGSLSSQGSGILGTEALYREEETPG